MVVTETTWLDGDFPRLPGLPFSIPPSPTRCSPVPVAMAQTVRVTARCLRSSAPVLQVWWGPPPRPQLQCLCADPMQPPGGSSHCLEDERIVDI